MKRKNQEFVVGLFVIAGFVAFVYISLQLGDLPFLSMRNHYQLTAKFNDISGLKEGAAVELAGVSIGRVQEIGLNNDRAQVTMQIRQGVKIAIDAIVSVRTRGIIGDKYLRITPGGADELLRPGEEILETESAVDLEELVSKYIFGDL